MFLQTLFLAAKGLQCDLSCLIMAQEWGDLEEQEEQEDMEVED